MKAKASQLRQAILRLEASRSRHVQNILGILKALQPGTVVHLERKCGKPNCRCATGPGHAGVYLSFKHKGRTRLVYIPAGKREQVLEEAEHYRRFRSERALLAKKGKEVLVLIDQLGRELLTEDPLGPARE